MKTARIKLNLNLIAFIIVLVLYAVTQKARAQKLEFATMAQQTVMGLQTGYSADFRTKSGWGVGTFFQSTNHLSFEKSPDNYPFYGIDISAPITKCGNLQLLGHLKAGFVNQNYLIATPELETRFKINQFIKLGFGAGYRSREAAVSAKVIINTI